MEKQKEKNSSDKNFVYSEQNSLYTLITTPIKVAMQVPKKYDNSIEDAVLRSWRKHMGKERSAVFKDEVRYFGKYCVKLELRLECFIKSHSYQIEQHRIETHDPHASNTRQQCTGKIKVEQEIKAELVVNCANEETAEALGAFARISYSNCSLFQEFDASIYILGEDAFNKQQYSVTLPYTVMDTWFYYKSHFDDCAKIEDYKMPQYSGHLRKNLVHQIKHIKMLNDGEKESLLIWALLSYCNMPHCLLSEVKFGLNKFLEKYSFTDKLVKYRDLVNESVQMMSIVNELPLAREVYQYLEEECEALKDFAEF